MAHADHGGLLRPKWKSEPARGPGVPQFGDGLRRPGRAKLPLRHGILLDKQTTPPAFFPAAALPSPGL